MTRSMALSFGEHGIRVNAICPGFTDSAHLRQWLSGYDNPELAEQEMLKLHPLKQIVQPEDIAKQAVYLACDDSRMVSGAVHVIDGGLLPRLYNSDLI